MFCSTESSSGTTPWETGRTTPKPGERRPGPAPPRRPPAPLPTPGRPAAGRAAKATSKAALSPESDPGAPLESARPTCLATLVLNTVLVCVNNLAEGPRVHPGPAAAPPVTPKPRGVAPRRTEERAPGEPPSHGALPRTHWAPRGGLHRRQTPACHLAEQPSRAAVGPTSFLAAYAAPPARHVTRAYFRRARPPPSSSPEVVASDFRFLPQGTPLAGSRVAAVAAGSSAAVAGGRRSHAAVLRGQAGGRRVRGREGGPGRLPAAVPLCAPGSAPAPRRLSAGSGTRALAGGRRT